MCAPELVDSASTSGAFGGSTGIEAESEDASLPMLGYSGESPVKECGNCRVAASCPCPGGAGGPSKINCGFGPSGGSTSRSGRDSPFQPGALGGLSNTDCGLDTVDGLLSGSGGVGDVSGMKSCLRSTNDSLLKFGSLGGLLKINCDLRSEICSISGSMFDAGSVGGPSK